MAGSDEADRGSTVLAERAVLAPASRTRHALPAAGHGPARAPHGDRRSLISQALQRSDGTVAHAARLLALRRTTLVEKLRKFGMAGAPRRTRQ